MSVNKDFLSEFNWLFGLHSRSSQDGNESQSEGKWILRKMEITKFAPAVIPSTGSDLNTEVDQHLAKTTLGWRLLGIS